jgi:hypothetical protein
MTVWIYIDTRKEVGDTTPSLCQRGSPVKVKPSAGLSSWG